MIFTKNPSNDQLRFLRGVADFATDHLEGTPTQVSCNHGVLWLERETDFHRIQVAAGYALASGGTAAFVVRALGESAAGSRWETRGGSSSGDGGRTRGPEVLTILREKLAEAARSEILRRMREGENDEGMVQVPETCLLVNPDQMLVHEHPVRIPATSLDAHVVVLGLLPYMFRAPERERSLLLVPGGRGIVHVERDFPTLPARRETRRIRPLKDMPELYPKTEDMP